MFVVRGGASLDSGRVMRGTVRGVGGFAAFLLAAVTAGGVWAAQGPAECASLECAPRASAGAPTPALPQVWQAAAELHQLKLQFVAALQRVTRAQTGTIGDEGEELTAGLRAMHEALAEWDARLQQFDRATSRLAPHADLSVARATVFLDRLRAADASRELAEAARLDAERPDVPALLALAGDAAGKPAEVFRALRRAVALDPGNVALWYRLAQRAAELKNQAEATRAWTRVTELLETVSAPAAPSADRAPFERAGLLRQAAGVAPIFPIAIYGAAYAQLAAGDLAAGLASFEEALGGDPMTRQAPAVRNGLKRAGDALRSGRVREARVLLEEVAHGAPDAAEPRRALGVVFRVEQQSQAAVEHARAAVRLDPANERARLLLAELLEESGRAAEATQALEDAVRAVPASGTAHYRLGVLRQAEARLPEVLTAWRESVRIGPVVGQDHQLFLIGNAAVNQADFDGAVSAYAARIAANPNNAEAHRQLGEVYFLQGRDLEALAEHSIAAFLSPASGRAHAGRGHALLRLGRHAPAVAAFERAVALGAGQAEVCYAFGTALVRAGRADEGRRQLEISQQLRADGVARGQRDFQIETLRRRAAGERAAGRHAEAVPLLEEVLSLDPSAPRSHSELGLVLLAAGRSADAVPHLTAAQRAEPTADGARALAEAHAAAGDVASSRAAADDYQALAARALSDRLARLTGRAP
jgi:tetratricopeptide (TPR) repeat protein